MTEIHDFGTTVLIAAAGFTLALATSKLTERVPVPGPALFLVTAAIASDVFPVLSEHTSIREVERIGVIGLVLILFDGGMQVGWDRFRAAALPIVALGTLGTFATAGVTTVAAHWLLDFSWITAGILGAAIAPTDPAVMFSVLGNREIGGRAGTILEGESGANDPIGIALMLGMLDLATHPDSSFWVVVREFAIEMSVGLAIGVAGALLLRRLIRVSLPSASLYPLRTLAAAATIYGVAAVAHGSGFLAVFVAGLLVGDEHVPFRDEIKTFHKALANLAEIVVFVALGLTIDITDLGANHLWLDGVVLALILAFVARPVVVAALIWPARLHWGERTFVMWGGLKGAVPILLTTLAILAEVADARRLYGIVFVVVAFSVVVQGTSLPLIAGRLGVPIEPSVRNGGGG
jgi:cell volume regulation protein A